jgi:sialic acid synthase SpsE
MLREIAGRRVGPDAPIFVIAEIALNHEAASRRGLYTRRAMRAGDQVTRDDGIVLRPATALAPSHLDALAGVTLQRDIAARAPFELEDLAGGGA